MFNILIKNINRYLGWRNWAVFYYNSIFENLFIFFYIALRNNDYSNDFIINIIIFLLFSLFSTTYGYLINDFADRELDKKHGKENTFSGDSTIKAIFVVLLFLLLAFAFAFTFLQEIKFLVLWLIWLFLSTFYSLKPLRFKEWGRIGLIIVVFAQRVLPILILFAAFKFFLQPDWLILAGYLFLRGMSSDMNHQLADYQNDLQTHTKTSAVVSGFEKYKFAYNIIVELEKMYLLFILFFISSKVDSFKFYNISVPALFCAFTIFLYLLSLYLSFKNKKIYNPYDMNKNINQIIMLLIPNILLPFVLLLKLTAENYWFLLFYLIIILIYRLYSIDALQKSIVGVILAKIKAKF